MRKLRFPIVLLAAAAFFSGCGHEEIPPLQAVAADPMPAFNMAGRDRHLNDLPEILPGLGLETAGLNRFYQGPAFSLWSLRVKGEEAIGIWGRLRDVVGRTQAWPVVIGLPAMEKEITDSLAMEGFDAAQIMAAAAAVDPPQWLAKQRKLDATFDKPPRGRAPAAVKAMHQYIIHKSSSTGDPLPLVSIVLVPTVTPWEVPAFLNFGGWNQCPEPAVQVAMLRRWNLTNGAEMVGMGRDILELRVGRPIVDRREALGRAYEQFVFCADIVLQGTESVDRLAAEIKGATVWFFWWD